VQRQQLVLQLHVAVALGIGLQVAEVACMARIGAVFAATCARSANACIHEEAPAHQVTGRLLHNMSMDVPEETATVSKRARTVGGIERVPVAAGAHAALAQITKRVYVKAVLAVGLETCDRGANADGVVGGP
jgi:hypothetical protein